MPRYIYTHIQSKQLFFSSSFREPRTFSPTLSDIIKSGCLTRRKSTVRIAIMSPEMVDPMDTSLPSRAQFMQIVRQAHFYFILLETISRKTRKRFQLHTTNSLYISRTVPKRAYISCLFFLSLSFAPAPCSLLSTFSNIAVQWWPRPRSDIQRTQPCLNVPHHPGVRA
jgi:hypothetical protein